MKNIFLSATALAALGASAQTPEATLRPIVVTPTAGVAQQAFDTPASVDVVTGEQMRNAQMQVNLSEPLVRVPGVVALNRQNYAQDLQISVRGFGARSTFGVRGIRLYSDGIPATMPDGQGQVSHFDLSSGGRLEVLRGPFSALYGNSSGGVISLFTADGLPGLQVEGGAAFGSDGVQRENLRFAGEQGAWNWNVDATHFETDGFRDHSAAKRNGLNAKARWQASTDTRATFVANAVDMPDVQDPLGLTRAEWEADPRQASPAALQFNTRKSVNQQQVGAIVEHRLNEVHGLKLTTWGGRRGTEQFQAIPTGVQAPITHPGGVIALDRDYRGVDGQWIARTRAWGGGLTVTAGLYADELQERRQGFRNFLGAPGAPTTVGVMGVRRRDEDNKVRSFDQYAQGVWEGERFSVTAGVRHSEIKFESQDHFIVGANGDDSGSVTYSATTPVLGVVFHATDALNLYASVGKGFETPTSNELSYRPDGTPGLNLGLQPARSRQWEIGAKAQPLANWNVNAALFQAKTNDEIVVATNSGGRSTFQNAAETMRRGFELALTGSWAQSWSTYAALTWLDATYESGFTCVSTSCPAGSNQVAAGNRIPGIPKFSAYAEVAWKHRPWGLETALELRHVGGMAVDDRNTDFTSAATVFNVRLSLAQVVNRWTFREFVRLDNIADRNYVGSIIVNEANRRYFESAPGRTWLVGANAIYAF
jgi:iron complex outermembrane receptor protein